MNARQIEYECAALARIARGVNMLADAVACTLGPQGRNVILERKGHAPVISKDGVSIACEIVLQDPLDNIGAQSVKEAAVQTAATAGDGWRRKHNDNYPGTGHIPGRPETYRGRNQSGRAEARHRQGDHSCA